MRVTRRRLLSVGSGVALVHIAGCAGDEGNQSSNGATEGSSAEIELTVEVSGPHAERVFFEEGDVGEVGAVIENQGTNYALPVELTGEGVERATDAFRDVGAADAPEDAEFIHMFEGNVETQQTFSVTPSLAEAIDSNEWGGVFRLLFGDREQVETVKESLENQ